MDIEEIQRTTVDLEITHPVSGEPTGLVLTLRSLSDPEIRRMAEASLEKQRAAARRQKQFTVRQEIAEDIRIKAACVTAINWGDASLAGEKPELSLEVAEKLLAKDFIYKQVTQQLLQDEDFFTE
jgi:hypothetical protein